MNVENMWKSNIGKIHTPHSQHYTQHWLVTVTLTLVVVNGAPTITSEKEFDSYRSFYHIALHEREKEIEINEHSRRATFSMPYCEMHTNWQLAAFNLTKTHEHPFNSCSPQPPQNHYLLMCTKECLVLFSVLSPFF